MVERVLRSTFFAFPTSHIGEKTGRPARQLINKATASGGSALWQKLLFYYLMYLLHQP
jgi:hypothetical protein